MQSITDLATLGWPLFPVLSGSKNPATKNGFKDSSCDPAQIARWMKQHPNCNWGVCPPKEAWVLDIDPLDDGSPNKAFNQDQLFEIASTAGAISTTPGKLNPSTGAFTVGKHYWFRQPNPGKWISRNGWLPNVDCRSQTGYVVIPPSIRPHGVYEWALPLDCRPEELPLPPDWLIEMVNQDQGGKKSATVTVGEPVFVPPPSNAPTDVITHGLIGFVNTSPAWQKKALDLVQTVAGGTLERTDSEGTSYFKRPGKQDQGHSATWNAPAGRHGVSGRSKESLWFPRFYVFTPNWPPFACEDSNGHRKGYDTWELIHTLVEREELPWIHASMKHDFSMADGSLVAMYESMGMEEPDEEFILKINSPDEDEQDEPAVEPEFPEPALTLDPNDLLHLIRHSIREGGIIDRFAKEVERREYKRQPLFRYSGGIAVLSSLLAGKVMAQDGSRSILYQVNIAPSGEGKDCARDAVNQVLTRAEQQANPEAFCNPDRKERPQSLIIKLPHSSSGLISCLRRKPARLLLIDELGAVLRGLAESSNGFNRPILTALTELFTAKPGPWQVPEYADDRANGGPLESPHLVLQAFTVVSELLEALTPESVTSGLLPRVLLYFGENRPEDCEPDLESDLLSWDQDLISQCVDWLKLPGGSDFTDYFHVWRFETAAVELIRQASSTWTDKRRTMTDAGQIEGTIYTRCAETAKRIALVFAADRLSEINSETVKGHTITAADITVGIQLVEHTASQMISLCQKHLASTAMGRGVKVLADWFTRQSGWVTLTQLAKGCRHRVLENVITRDQILNDLVKQQFLETERYVVGGRELFKYRVKA